MPTDPAVYLPPSMRGRDPGAEQRQAMLARGDAAARGHMAQGQILADTVGSLGHAAGQAIQAHQEMKQQRELTRQDSALAVLLDSPEPKKLSDFVKVVGPRRGLEIFKGYSELMRQDKPPDLALVAGGFDALKTPELRAAAYPSVKGVLMRHGMTEEMLPPEYSEEWWQQARGHVLPAAKTRDIKTRNADGSETVQIVEDRPGQSFTSAAEPPKRHIVTVPGPNGQPMQRLATEDELAQGVEQYSAPGSAGESEPLMAVMGDDGQPVYVTRAEAKGRRPASTREQGRSVISGDANKIAELDTSLGDADELERELKGNDATGVGAALGAALPPAVTAVTGWGTDAKKKQAVIARVKQVIGKALEGGVLKAEDERKYADILPNISDPPAIAASKIAGLKAAITRRRGDVLDNLERANYDVSRFRSSDAARAGVTGGAKPAADPDADALIDKYLGGR